MASNVEKGVRLMVRTSLSQREIAKKLDVTEETVSRWKKRSDFDEIRKREEREYLGDLAAPALRAMKGLLEAKSELVRYNAASDILDRTGYKPVDVLKDRLTQAQIDKIHNDIVKDETAEDKLSEYLDILGKNIEGN